MTQEIAMVQDSGRATFPGQARSLPTFKTPSSNTTVSTIANSIETLVITMFSHRYHFRLFGLVIYVSSVTKVIAV